MDQIKSINQIKPITRCGNDFRCEKCLVRSKIFCDLLDQTSLRSLSTKVKHKFYTKDIIVLKKGDEIRYIYNVIKGNIKVYQLDVNGDIQVLGFLYPGDFFGSHEGGKYEYFAETIGHAMLCQIPIGDFRQYMENNPNIQESFYKSVVNELKLARTQIGLITRMTAEKRVVSFLNLLSEKQELLGQSNNPVVLPMKRKDIANYLGLSVETVSRIITKLRKLHQIKCVNHNCIYIKNVEDGPGKIA